MAHHRACHERDEVICELWATGEFTKVELADLAGIRSPNIACIIKKGKCT